MCKIKDLPQVVGVHNHPLSLDSGCSVEAFVTDSAVDFQRKYMAITDHGTIGAILEAQEVAQKLKKNGTADITIIPGVEAYLMPDTPQEKKAFSYYHLTIHMDDFETYLKFCRLNKAFQDRAINKGGEPKPLMTWAELESLSGKITILSGCLVGAVSRPWLKGMKDVSEHNFKRLMSIAGPGRFFAEIFPYELSKNWDSKTQSFKPIDTTHTPCCTSGKLQKDANDWIFSLAHKYNIPTVVAEDAHFVHERDKFVQDMRLGNHWRMSDANCVHDNEWLFETLKELHPEVVDEGYFTKMVENSYDVANNFKGWEPKFEHAIPVIELGDKKVTEEREILALFSGIIKEKNRIDLSDDRYRSRLLHEIRQLSDNGKINLLPYFWVIYEIVEWCSRSGILVGPARGSAAGSLLSYAIGITQVDPIKENLSFERFFDVTRVEEGLADIDTDFSDRGRVIDFIKERWGDRVSYLGVALTFKTKTALKDIERFLNGSVSKETEAFVKALPSAPQGMSELDFLQGYIDSDGNPQQGVLETHPKLQAWLDERPTMKEYLFRIVGITRQMGRHAAGVLIADRPVHEFVPLVKVSGEYATQISPKMVEQCGGVKYDILGLNTLLDIQRTLENIKRTTGETVNPWTVPDNGEYWDSCLADPTSIFQIHTTTVRGGLSEMKPRGVQQMAILTALFRPGAMDAPADDGSGRTMERVFLDRWTGKERVGYIHQDLIPYLKDTMGTIIFQETLSAIAHGLGGLSMPETNRLRKAISKKSAKDLSELLHKMSDTLLTDRGWSKQQADTLIHQMQASGRYSFNKSHAVSYSYIIRACAYLKHHYPVQWWAAVLSNASEDDLLSYWSHAQDYLKSPSVNMGKPEFRISDDAKSVTPPLSLVVGLGDKALNEIDAKGPFSSMQDFVMRIDRRVVNKHLITKMIVGGVFDEIEEGDIDQKLEKYIIIRRENLKEKNFSLEPFWYQNSTVRDFLVKRRSLSVHFKDWVKPDDPIIQLINKTSAKHQKINNQHSVHFRGRNYLWPQDADMALDFFEKKNFDNVAIPCYVESTSELNYSNNSKTALKVKCEIGGELIEFIKWPKWEEDHHQIKDSLSGEIVLLIMSSYFSKKKGLRELKLDDIINLSNSKGDSSVSG